MKTDRSRHPHDTLQTTLKAAFPIDQRRLTVLAALVLAIIQARTVVLYTLKNHVALPGRRDTRYQRLLRFVRFTVPDGLYTHFVLRLLPAGDLWLILDRTNWKLGKRDLNILLLSASWHSFSFPLLWTLLPHGSSSHQHDRILLLERFLSLRGNRRIAGLLADREFVGETWFTFLRTHHITPCIRLKASSRVNGIPVQACFAALQPGELRVWHRPALVYGVRLRVLASRNGERGSVVPRVPGVRAAESPPLRAAMAHGEPVRGLEDSRLPLGGHGPHALGARVDVAAGGVTGVRLGVSDGRGAGPPGRSAAQGARVRGCQRISVGVGRLAGFVAAPVGVVVALTLSTHATF